MVVFWKILRYMKASENQHLIMQLKTKRATILPCQNVIIIYKCSFVDKVRINIYEYVFCSLIRCRPVVRISGFHPGDPGSIPGNGTFFFHHSMPNLWHFLRLLVKKAMEDQLIDVVEKLYYKEDVQLQRSEAVKMLRVWIWRLQCDFTWSPSKSLVRKEPWMFLLV